MRVFAAPQEAPFSSWPGLASIIEVERTGRRGNKPFAECRLYVSSHTAEAVDFACIVRGHWQIENSLHRVKDVILGEDDYATCANYARQNAALLRSLMITPFRLAGFRSIKVALRRFAHDVPALYRLLE